MIADQSITPNGSTGDIPFVINDLQTAPSGLVLSASSSDPGLVPNENIDFGGSETNRTVRMTAANDQLGSATITIFVSDGFLTSSNSFAVNVNAVNQPPTISTIPNQSVTTNTPVGPISFTIGDFETPAPSLLVSAVSSNTNLVPNANIALSGTVEPNCDYHSGCGPVGHCRDYDSGQRWLADRQQCVLADSDLTKFIELPPERRLRRPRFRK